jgi:PAS domain S-box-containing protein
MDPIPWIPIKYKLPLTFMLICLVSLGVGGAVSYQTTKEILWNQIRQDLLAFSQRRVERITTYLRMLKNKTEDFSSDGFIRDTVRKLQESSSTPLQESLSLYLREDKASAVPEFFETLLVDKTGRIMASSNPDDVNVSVVREPWFKMSQQGIFIGEIQIMRTGMGRPVFEIAAPLNDKDNGSIIGVIVNRVDAQRLFTLVNNKDFTEDVLGESKQLETYLVNDQGYLLTTTGFVSLEEVFLKKRVSMPGSFNLGEKQIFTGISPIYAGREVIFGRAMIPGTTWSIVTEIGDREAFRPITILQRKLLLVSIGMFGVTLVLLLFPLKLMIIPLIRLREAAEKTEQKEFPAPVSATTHNEMGQLVRAFNRMSAGFFERTEELEHYSRELRKREKQIEYEKTLLDTIIHCMRDGVIFINKADDVVLCNAVAAEAFNANQVLGKPVTNCHPPSLWTAVKKDIEYLKGGIHGFHKIIQRRGRIYETTYTPIHDTNGEYLGIILVSRDITERKRMEEQLIRQEKLSVIGKISAAIAHEINNPLATIAMFSQLLSEEVSEDSPFREYTEVIQRNTHLCKKIIRGLLDYAVKSPDERTLFNIRHCLEEVVALTLPFMEKSGVKLVMEISEALPPYEGDEDQIKQTFMNLIINAIQAMETGGTLRIGAASYDGNKPHILVEFADTGVGIEEHHMEEIFHPFFTTKPKSQGTGLGLSICQHIVEAHGGQIRVKSKKTHGTTFAIYLPLGVAG